MGIRKGERKYKLKIVGRAVFISDAASRGVTLNVKGRTLAILEKYNSLELAVAAESGLVQKLTPGSIAEISKKPLEVHMYTLYTLDKREELYMSVEPYTPKRGK